MSGHNKWSKVKNVKGPLDIRRAKLFTKLTKEIIVSAQVGGGNPDGNPRLRQAILQARNQSMPKDNIERAIKKGTGELAQGHNIEAITYEGYGPYGIAVLIETASDNKNRTVSDLRTLFKSHGGSLGETGSVMWMFEYVGIILVRLDPKNVANHSSYDKLFEEALLLNARDVIQHGDDEAEIITDPTTLYSIKDSLQQKKFLIENAALSYIPKTQVDIVEKEKAKELLSFFDEIEDHEDVQKVHSNANIGDDLFKALLEKY